MNQLIKYIILFTSRPETMTQHRGQQLKPFVCTLCPHGMFSDFDKYKMHVRKHKRNGGQLYSRSSITRRYCVRASQSGQKIMKGHGHQRTHTKDKPYQCAYCDKSFSSSSHKTIQERIHTKEKPYQCAYCDKTFSDLVNKTKHARIHHVFTK